jgi:integrase
MPHPRFDDSAAWSRNALLKGQRWIPRYSTLPPNVSSRTICGQDVNFEAGVVRLEPGTTKNREGREFPFAVFQPLADLLEQQRDQTRELERKHGRIIAHVFHRNGKPIKSCVRAWKAACNPAGHEGRLVHDLLRSAVRNLERAGVSRSVAMKLTGHKTEAVYRRYAITSAADLSEGVAKLAVLHGAAKGSPSVVPITKGTIRAQSVG